MLKTIANVLWLLFAGLWLGIGYTLAGIVNCITIIGIPFGIASFRLGGYVVWPFGRAVVRKPGAGAGSTIGNVIWFVLGGIWMVIGQILVGAALCITIIGIPFGIACFKMVPLALAPFGKAVVPTEIANRYDVFYSRR